MSCDGWSVGDTCQSMVEMNVNVEVLDPRGCYIQLALVCAGTLGIVKMVQKVAHTMYVNFQGINGTAQLYHAQIHSLRRL